MLQFLAHYLDWPNYTLRNNGGTLKGNNYRSQRSKHGLVKFNSVFSEVIRSPARHHKTQPRKRDEGGFWRCSRGAATGPRGGWVVHFRQVSGYCSCTDVQLISCFGCSRLRASRNGNNPAHAADLQYRQGFIPDLMLDATPLGLLGNGSKLPGD